MGKPGTPVFLYAHSMGGLISMLALEQERDLVNAAVFTGPGLIIEISFLSSLFLRILPSLENCLPKLVIPAGAAVKWCSRNWVAIEWKKRDPLRMNTFGVK